MLDADKLLSPISCPKQPLNKEQNVQIDSAASSGGQGLTSLGLRLRQHCQFFTLVFLC